MIEDEKFSQALPLAFDLLEDIGSSNYLLKHQLESQIGFIFSKTNSHKKSLLYYKKALKSLQQSTSVDAKQDVSLDVQLMDTYFQIGSSFLRLEVYEDTTEVVKKDSAKFYFRKVENFPSLNDKILDIKGRTFTNLTAIYYTDSIYDVAKEYAQKAINIHKKRNNKLSQAGALGNLGSIYLDLGDYETAKEKYLEGLDLIRNINSSKADLFKANLYANLAWALRNLEDYTAYDQLTKSNEFTEKLRDNEVKRIVETITGQYDVDRVKRAERRNFWIYVIISILVIASLISFYTQRKRNLALKLEKANMIQKQKVEAVKSESQRRILNAVIEGKEKERKEIAETLHDSVSTLLSSANLHLQASAKQFNGDLPVEIRKTRVILAEASSKIRDLSHNLISALLIKFGLTYAIKDLAQKYSNSELQVEIDIEPLPRYPEKFEIKVYNIIQEIVNNILKHSKATQAKISMREVSNNIEIFIKDNGIGFDMNLVDMKEGIGIKQIEARVQLMHGDFQIYSQINKGTAVEISIPTIEVEDQVINV
ncbi:MAG: histidine kinase [Flavobacteriaceae bacterium]|nr:histidine kinase [Flavobacteriaceae bacterium]